MSTDTRFVLLARIIEAAGAVPLGVQLHERILGPAGMADSCLLFHTQPGGGTSPSGSPAEKIDLAPGVHLFVAPHHGIAIAMNFHSTREMTHSFRTHLRLVRAAMAVQR